METIELNELLKVYNQKVDALVKADRKILSQIRLEKPKETMKNVYRYRIVETVIFSVLAVFLGWYVFIKAQSTDLLVCGIIVMIFNIIALSGSISQLALINKIDYSKKILEIKERVEKINSHELYMVKILFLSAPFWWAFNAIFLDTVFKVDFLQLMNSDTKFVYIVIHIVLIIPLGYLLSQLNAKNTHKPIVRRAIKLFSSSKVLKTLEELDGIEKFKL